MKDSGNDYWWDGGVGRLLLSICAGMRYTIFALCCGFGILFLIVVIPGWLPIIIILGLLSIFFVKGAWDYWHWAEKDGANRSKEEAKNKQARRRPQ